MWNQITRFLNEKLYRWIAFFLPPIPHTLPENPRSILVFSTTGIGDGLYDSAAIKSLKEGYPNAHLTVCTHHRRGSMARHNPFIDTILPLSKSPLSQFALLRHFRHKKPDLVVALHVNEEAVPLGYLLNRHAFVGSVERAQGMAFLLSHPIQTHEKKHMVEKMLLVATAAGGAQTQGGMVYHATQEEVAALSLHYPELKRPYVVFQTGGGDAFKWRNWPVASYIQAITWLQAHYPHQVVLTGGANNAAVGEAIVAACPWVLNCVQKTTLEETAALLQGASMLVSSDTGVMHLGIAMRCPTLALLHYRSNAAICGPLDFSPGHEVIELQKPEEAREIYEGELGLLPFEQVTAAMERILKR